MNNQTVVIRVNVDTTTMYPLRFSALEKAVKKARGNRKEVVEQITEALQTRLKQEGFKAEVIGREKHLFSLYKKMRKKRLSFEEVLDIFAFRVIVETVDDCYRALGLVHSLYKPLPGKFKDYIAIPKPNGYQSLHTLLFGPYGVHIEVQIRSEVMTIIGNKLFVADITQIQVFELPSGKQLSTIDVKGSSFLNGIDAGDGNHEFALVDRWGHHIESPYRR